MGPTLGSDFLEVTSSLSPLPCLGPAGAPGSVCMSSGPHLTCLALSATWGRPRALRNFTTPIHGIILGALWSGPRSRTWFGEQIISAGRHSAFAWKDRAPSLVITLELRVTFTPIRHGMRSALWALLTLGPQLHLKAWVSTSPSCPKCGAFFCLQHSQAVGWWQASFILCPASVLRVIPLNYTTRQGLCHVALGSPPRVSRSLLHSTAGLFQWISSLASA